MKSLNFILILVSISCNKIDPEPKNILSELKISSSEILANGETRIKLDVTLHPKTSPDRRSVFFESDGGTFISSSKDTATVKAQLIQGKIIASTFLIVSNISGEYLIKVRPSFNEFSTDYSISEKFIAINTAPSSLNISTSSFGISTNHLNEITLTSELKNINGKGVSKGYKISYKDFLLDFTPANGKFRDVQNVTINNSKLTSKYSASNLPIGTSIYITSTLLDSLNMETEISDTLELKINKTE